MIMVNANALLDLNGFNQALTQLNFMSAVGNSFTTNSPRFYRLFHP
jgi:hypothetical protein